ncbi:DUF6907 domain-containing protein [Streptosporangium sp. NBC_01756]|uniref:DUF6907 domain-containing protein n=1 Tax=Streptosporangium sp. NBC_01756 TaxID=2975950 RepID=UPI002DD8C428|nr:hypothetical protein [Streptosporangium sp. NBC_01756]WSC90081.1 hypothetical protein OIE48_18440 [Streptosporangium sp. NBC_01756]
MSETVPTSTPCPPWCTHEHKPGDDFHAAFLFNGPPSVLLLQTDENGAFPEGNVRIIYPRGDYRGLMEIKPTIAADFGDVLNALTIQNAGDFAAALLRTQKLIEPQEWEVAGNAEGDAR